MSDRAVAELRQAFAGEAAEGFFQLRSFLFGQTAGVSTHVGPIQRIYWMGLPTEVREAAASAYVLAERAPLHSFGGRGGGVAAAYEVLLAYAQRVP